MPKVWNKREKGIPVDAIYVGRPTKWGNPYVIGDDGTREQVIEKYREYLENALLSASGWCNLSELKGKDLICWCAPKACHADILLEVANVAETE